MAINSANYIKGQSLYKESCFLLKKGKLEHALIKLKESVDYGYPDALFQLGIGYYYGISVNKNIKYSIGLFTRAAEKNHEEAMYHLAEHYYNSNQKSKSKSLFIRLLKMDNKKAKYYCYLNGWNKDNRIDLRRAAFYNIERHNQTIII